MSHSSAGSDKDRFTQSQDWIDGLSSDFDLRLPHSLRWLSALALLGIGLAIVLWLLFESPTLSLTVLGVGLLHASPAILGAAIIWGLRVPRMRIRNRMVGSIDWRGDEQVLDVGTGNGILLIGCAEQLVDGTITGIDIWNPNAGGGTEEIFWKNVRNAGVEDRVELHNTDVREMPFADETFALITSSFAAHHFGKSEDRVQAVQEIVRVLAPDGQIVFYDVGRALNDLSDTIMKKFLYLENNNLSIFSTPYSVL